MKFFNLLLFIAFVSATNGSRILFVAPFTAKSHWLYLQSFVRALLERGHHVTCITSNPLGDQNYINYTEVLIDPPLNMETLRTQADLFRTSVDFSIAKTWKIPHFGTTSAEYSLSSRNVQRFLHEKHLHFDLVINEEFFHDVYLMFGYKYKAPTVTIATLGCADFVDRQMGFLTPWSHVPNTLVTYNDDMSFTERWYNSMLSICDWIVRRFIYFPRQNELARKFFGHLGEIPTVEELTLNISLALINTHHSVQAPRPSMPSIVYVGGAHIKPPKPLPADLQRFIDEAQYGVIYFSLGTVLKTSQMPADKLQIVLDSLKMLKQRVIWKYEEDKVFMDRLPSNVMIRKWCPQSDILAHKNVRLFISHAGMFGTFEAIARGVPILMIPFFGDQHRNAVRAVRAGYAKILDFNNVSIDLFVNAVNEMMSNASYANKMNEISSIYSDNVVHPMDTAMFWIEYIIRHSGAKHLKSHAVKMSWFSYLLLDVLLVNLLIFATFIFLLYLALQKCRRKPKSTLRDKKTE
ncbi:UDP-glucosyltransferase 2-like [Sitodiplosis mosellana]|uniref:UDP-glucosyltransferase 2-like n=1 Tax=Sitodiplosis mosellana TaxID=263140 RepID=UPI002444FB39|nr:UDP-glucosyltransferase 2-like [Sitodiplosis mosellana]